MGNTCFIPFIHPSAHLTLPNGFNDPFGDNIPEIARIAAAELQDYLLENQSQWQHSFGNHNENDASSRGKMFGVLVVENSDHRLGYLSTFSGKIKDNPHPTIFVPSVFDTPSNQEFLSIGMTELSEINTSIKALEIENVYDLEIAKLKKLRQEKSNALQNKIFKHYTFSNEKGDFKDLFALFKDYNNKKPAAGAGECAAPKLLQYAFENKMKPKAIAEFWWGQSTLSDNKKHKSFYPACNDKCRPILHHMLSK